MRVQEGWRLLIEEQKLTRETAARAFFFWSEALVVVPGNLDDGRKKRLAMHVVADLCEFFVWKAGWMMGACLG